MVKIVIGTTPTIKYTFSTVDPADFAEAIMTIKDSRKQEKHTLNIKIEGAKNEK